MAGETLEVITDNPEWKDLQKLDPEQLWLVTHTMSGHNVAAGGADVFEVHGEGIRWDVIRVDERNWAAVTKSGKLTVPPEAGSVPEELPNEESERRTHRARLGLYAGKQSIFQLRSNLHDELIDTLENARNSSGVLNEEAMVDQIESLMADAREKRDGSFTKRIEELNDYLEEENDVLVRLCYEGRVRLQDRAALLKGFVLRSIVPFSGNEGPAFAAGLVLAGPSGELGFVPKDYRQASASYVQVTLGEAEAAKLITSPPHEVREV